MLRLLAASACLLFSGCSLLPEMVHQPTLHNPFPQLSKVAVAPFFNLSNEPTLNGDEVADAYFAELQLVPGFEVVPVGVVKTAMLAHGIELAGPTDARRLAQVLDVDAVVLGAITDYTPYYPPRMGLKVEWYAANPGFHPVPPGYGLPWGTPEEEQIPDPLVLEAEFALAKEQLKTQSPAYQDLAPPGVAPTGQNPAPAAAPDAPPDEAGASAIGSGIRPLAHAADGWTDELSPQTNGEAPHFSAIPGPVPDLAGGEGFGIPPAGLPPDWPDPRGFVPDPPRVVPPTCWPSNGPVMSHTRVYQGNDLDFTTALETYYTFRDESRPGGWQGYLQRSDDFVRFCCHKHVWEMLTARGGAGETRVVWRWPSIR
jgi:hypothetical protein